MQTKSYQLFAELCESFLDEASTSINLIGSNPGGTEVIKTLHKDMGLAHDIGYRPVEKISWSDLKNMYQGAWVIIVGSKGTGAIKATSNNYEALASVGGEVQNKSDGRGGNILDFLKANIGKLNKFYVGKNTSYVRDTQKKRGAYKQGDDGQTVTQSTLIKKFRPLWAKAIEAAIADVKGHVANMIKNDSFEKAKKKLNHIETLQRGAEAIEAGTAEESPDFIRGAINAAVLMAASHHYPEQTGTIQRGYSRDYSAQFNEGPQQLLKDISAGDQKKLGTVLGFFKRNLISG